MKKLILQIFCLLLTSTALNAQLSVKATEALEKEADADRIKSREYLMEFILKRDTNIYSLGNTIMTGSLAKYKKILKEGTASEAMAGLTGVIIDSKISLVKAELSMYGSYFRDRLMKEPEDKRKKKMEYNGVEYLISSDSKENYKNLKETNEKATKKK